MDNSDPALFVPYKNFFCLPSLYFGGSIHEILGTSILRLDSTRADPMQWCSLSLQLGEGWHACALRTLIVCLELILGLLKAAEE